MMHNKEIKNILDSYLCRMEYEAFVLADPVQFPRRYDKKQDIEISALLTALISWGGRKMILRNADSLLSRMGESPFEWIKQASIADFVPQNNVHRTLFEKDLLPIIFQLKGVYSRFDSLEDYLLGNYGCKVDDCIEGLYEVVASAKVGSPSRKSACKRMCMMFRWLVRNDGADMGIWKSFDPKDLYIPLDVHVAYTARGLGLLKRKGNDWTAVTELTNRLREFCPDDPVKYDYALFRIGLEKKMKL